MKITVMSLDSSCFFVKGFEITEMEDLEKLQGYCGTQLYIRVEETPDDHPQVVSAVEGMIRGAGYKTDFFDAAIILFMAIEMVKELKK
jgi:hypothetical protein